MDLGPDLIESLQFALLIVDGDGRIAMANQEAGRLFGYATSELLGQPVEMLVPRRLAAAHAQHRTEKGVITRPWAMASERQLFALRRDQTEVPVAVTLSPVAVNGTPMMLCTVHDQTAMRYQQQRESAVSQVREAVWQMRESGDVVRVIEVLREKLLQLGISFAGLGINVVDLNAGGLHAAYGTSACAGGQVTRSLRDPRSAVLAPTASWQQRKVIYRPDLHREDLWGDRVWADQIPGGPVRSVVDIPFSHGTLALNSTAPDAFTPETISLLEEMAVVLADGFHRLADLQALERRADEAEALSQAIATMANSTDVDQVLQTVVAQVKRVIPVAQVAVFLHDPEACLPGDGGNVLTLPLKLADRDIGVLALRPRETTCTPNQRSILEHLAAQAALAIERSEHLRRLEDETAERNRQLARQRAVAQVRQAIWQMQREADIEQVLKVMNSQLQALSLPFDVLAVNIVDDCSGPVEVKYHVFTKQANTWKVIDTRDPAGEAARRAPAERIAAIWRSGQVAYRPDLQTADPFGEYARMRTVYPQVRTVIDVPFARGTLALNSSEPDAFRPDMVVLLQEIAEVLSGGFQRLDDLRQLEHRALESEALATATDAIAGSHSLDEALQLVAKETAKVINCPRVRVLRFDPQEGALVALAAVGFDQERLKQVLIPPGKGLSGHVFATGKPHLLGHPGAPEIPPLEESTARLLTAALLDSDGANSRKGAAAPLRIAGQVIGVLVAGGYVHPAKERHLELLERLGESAALAIERFQYIEALRQSEHRFRSLFDLSHDAIMTLGPPNWKFTAANAATVAMFGARDPEHFRAHRPWQLSPERQPDGRDSEEKAREMIETALREGSHFFEWTHRRIGGEVFPATVLLSRMAANRQVFLQATVRDITESKRVEEAQTLNLALQRLRNENLRMESEKDWYSVVVAFDRELRALVNIHRSSLQLIDLAADRFVAYVPHQPEAANRTAPSYPLTPVLRQVVEGGQPVYRCNRQEIDHCGRFVEPAVNSVVDVPFRGGTVAMNSLAEDAFTGRDIRVLQAFAEVLSEAYQRLGTLRELGRTRAQLLRSQKLEAVGQLTAGIAHNFNNLLQANLANIDLAMAKGPPAVMRFLTEAEAAGIRAAELVQQLMLFARAEADTESLQAVDLGGVAENTAHLCRKVIDRSIELRVESPPGLPLVSGSVRQLEQVLMNLVLNARDALAGVERQRSSIVVRVGAVRRCPTGSSEEGDYVFMEVQDNGTGMDRATLDRIFEPFFTTKEAGKGTGLGLATVYGIVQRHGGWVDCQSLVGEGTVFSVFVPVAKKETPPAQPLEASPEPLGGTEVLLVIDDEAAVRHSTAEALSAFGYRVLEAENGMQGLEVYRQARERIGLVLLDLSMPGLSGREVLKQLRTQDPQAKVVVFTGYAVGAEGLEGAVQVVRKPYALKKLAKTIREILDD